MATIALTIAGSALGGPVGAAIGGFIGSYIDKNILIPGIIGKPEVRGPTVGELSVQTVEEGQPANVIYGPENRTTGPVIWTSDYIVEQVKEDAGGKGGGDKVVTGHKVFIHVAIEICRNEIQSLQKIIANGDVVYDANPDKGVSSNQIYIRRESSIDMDITSPPGGPDLSVFRSGLDIDVSGFTNTANNGTFRVESSKKTPTGLSRVRVRNVLGADEIAGPLIILYQQVPKFNQEKVQDITIYLGTNTQMPDPLIESFEGPGEVPGYRGIAYVVMKKFFCGDYGNQLPQFATVAKESSSMTSGQVIEKIMARAKGSGATVLTSEATRPLAGYPIHGLVPTAQALQPVQIALNVLDQETDSGAIRFFDREKAFIVEVPEDYLGAVSGGNPHRGNVEITPDPKRNAPSEVHVGYMDRDAEYGNGNQSQNRPLPHYKSEKFEFPLVLDGAGVEARMIARTLLWILDFDRTKYNVALPPSFLRMLENDVIRTPVNDRVLDLLIERADIGDDYMLELECVRDVREVLEQVGVADPPSAGGDSVTNPPNVLVIPLDIPISGAPTPSPGPGPGGPGGGGVTSGSTPNRPGYGVILIKTDDEDDWPGGVIQERTGALESDPYSRISVQTIEATAGRCKTTLGNATGGIWDMKNTLKVELFRGELESRSADAVLSGMNRAVVGNEIIGFMNADLVDTNTYELTGLLRGLRDTKLLMQYHVAEEYFVYLNGGGINFVEITPARIGVPFFLKGVAVGAAIEDADDVPVTIEAKNLNPFAPVNIAAYRSGSDVVVSWNRRTREYCRLFGAKPLGEDFERYEIDVSPEGADPVYTVVVDDLTTWTLDGVALEDAGLFPESNITIEVFQVSGIVGRGRGVSLDLLGAMS